ncbi:MAG: hypothetical protein U0768_22020 [Anaerolineae bacterium]
MVSLLPVVAIFALITAGVGLAGLVTPRGWTWSAAEGLAVALMLGATFVSLAVFVIGFTLRGVALQLAVLSAAAALGLAGIAVGRRRQGKVHVARPTPGELAAWVVVLAQLGGAAWLAFYRSDLGWDGLVNWELKAHLACLNNGSPPLAYFQDSTWVRTHPTYPWLVPGIETWLYLWAGQCSQSLAKLAPFLFCAAAVGLLYAGGVRLAGSRLTGLLAAILLFCIPLVLIGEGSATSGYADFPVGVAYLGAAIYLLAYIRTRQRGILGLVGAMTVPLVWGKAEGAILLACLGLVLAVHLLRDHGASLSIRLTDASLALLPGLVVYGAWLGFLKLNQTPPPTEFLPMTVSTFAANIGRLGDVAAYWQTMVKDWPTWGAFWPFLLAACIVVVLGARGVPRGILALLGLPLAAYSTIFVFSSWADPTDHIQSSLGRLALQIAPLGALTIALALNHLPRLGKARLWSRRHSPE